jgi:hypothetical protein
VWWGVWDLGDHHPARVGTLFIREVGSRGFLFDLLAVNGAHTGEISGFARFTGPHTAVASMPTDERQEYCELTFRRRLNGIREITIEEGPGCLHYHGMGAFFDGRYIRPVDVLHDTGILDELDLARLFSITGEYYKGLTDCFQSVSVAENLDPFSATVTSGGVRGLYTIMEGILMRGTGEQLWVAYIDGDEVRYFTTEHEYKTKLPVTIERWRERFSDRRVVFDSPVHRIPRTS